MAYRSGCWAETEPVEDEASRVIDAHEPIWVGEVNTATTGTATTGTTT